VVEEKRPEPKEIPDKFAHDPIAREAYLAGWSDCGARVMAQVPVEDPATSQVFDLGQVLDLGRRVAALEGQYRALAGDAADNAGLIRELQRKFGNCVNQRVREG